MAAGRRRAEKVRPPRQRGRLALLVLGLVAGAAAWVFLVGAAIDFGRSARRGDGSGLWALTVAAALGAALCLLLVFVLVARVRDLLAGPRPEAPTGARGGGHRR